jgi:hypothetical protein
VVKDSQTVIDKVLDYLETDQVQLNMYFQWTEFALTKKGTDFPARYYPVNQTSLGDDDDLSAPPVVTYTFFVDPSKTMDSAILDGHASYIDTMKGEDKNIIASWWMIAAPEEDWLKTSPQNSPIMLPLMNENHWSCYMCSNGETLFDGNDTADECCDFQKTWYDGAEANNQAYSACKLARAKGGRLFWVPRVTHSNNQEFQKQLGWCQAGQCVASENKAENHFACDRDGSKDQETCEGLETGCWWTSPQQDASRNLIV